MTFLCEFPNEIWTYDSLVLGVRYIEGIDVTKCDGQAISILVLSVSCRWGHKIINNIFSNSVIDLIPISHK